MLITPEEKANTRRNIEQYEWARTAGVRAVEQAGEWGVGGCE